ncbi:MAG: hypothetical protein K0R65_2154 [Crocinitomicaceae bacterium]|jgi:chromosome segregation ATPase|nr:hypothetical protein [Crocinitomicaceae bacterium]
MTEKISHIIGQLETKFFALKQQLDAETSRNGQLSTELESLKADKGSLAGQIAGLESEIIKLKEENKELQEQNQQQDPILVSTGDKDMEIDFLVREIDQCISQIKNNL